jgi:mono/diheme cytochrome c family protein
MMFKLVLVLVCLIMFGALLMPTSAKSQKCKPVSGAALYKTHCASCHGVGGNLVSDKHPIAGSSHLESLAEFKQYLSAPAGHMPHYPQIIGNDQQLKALYDYCKKLNKSLKQAHAADKKTFTSFAPRKCLMLLRDN